MVEGVMPSSYARLTVAALFCLLGAPAALADPSSDTSPFTEAEVLNGKIMSEDDCSRLVGAVWVVVDGRGDCMRYWLSTAGGDTKQALLYLHGDVVLTIGSKRSASQTYLKVSPAKLSEQAAEWSKRRKGTYIYLARPGAYGSSGNHSQRRRIREVRLVDAALDAIREKHGIERFHLVGQSGGGHLVASVLPLRDDVGCAVITSGVISVRTRTKDLGRSVDPTGFTDPYDPIVDLDRIAKPDDSGSLSLPIRTTKGCRCARRSNM